MFTLYLKRQKSRFGPPTLINVNILHLNFQKLFFSLELLKWNQISLQFGSNPDQTRIRIHD